MADDKFIEIPYAGYNPSLATMYAIGIDSRTTSYKISCYITSSGYTVSDVYACAIGSSVFYLSQYGNQGNMTINSCTDSSQRGGQNMTSSYLVPGTNVYVRYLQAPTDYYVPKAIETVTPFDTIEQAALAFLALFPSDYVNISYVGNGCSIGGVSYASIGATVTVPVTLPIGASLTADNISVTKNGTVVDFNYNSQTQVIAFTAI